MKLLPAAAILLSLPFTLRAAMPIGLRTAAFCCDDGADEDGDFITLDGGMELGDVSVESGKTLVLAGDGVTAWSVTFNGTPSIAVDKLPENGKLLTLLDGETWETPLSLTVGGSETAGYSLCSEPDGLYALPADAYTAGGCNFATLKAAAAAAGDGGKIALLRDAVLEKRFDLPCSLSIDLAGRTMRSNGMWAFNAGAFDLAVENGSIDAADCGFYVTEGSLTLENCRVVAKRRVVQVRGAGKVRVAESSSLETTGEDPVVFAVGGYAGRAGVDVRGVLVQSCMSGPDTTAYDIAGNPGDTFGADFTLGGDGAACFAQAADECIHHPDGQGGGVGISGGWYSMRPPSWQLETGYGAKPETLWDVDGWRVFLKGFFMRVR